MTFEPVICHIPSEHPGRHRDVAFDTLYIHLREGKWHNCYHPRRKPSKFSVPFSAFYLLHGDRELEPAMTVIVDP